MANHQTYQVQQGDTLWTLSRKFGIPVQTLIDANRITDPDKLCPGQRLLIPQIPGQHYVVQPGDTLWYIARRMGTTAEAIAEKNQLVNPETIYPGQILIIPRG